MRVANVQLSESKLPEMNTFGYPRFTFGYFRFTFSYSRFTFGYPRFTFGYPRFTFGYPWFTFCYPRFTELHFDCYRIGKCVNRDPNYFPEMHLRTHILVHFGHSFWSSILEV